MQNLVDENPNKRALGTYSFRSMSNIARARSFASQKARSNLAQKTLGGDDMQSSSFEIIHQSVVQNQDTGEYTIYIVMEAQ